MSPLFKRYQQDTIPVVYTKTINRSFDPPAHLSKILQGEVTNDDVTSENTRHTIVLSTKHASDVKVTENTHFQRKLLGSLIGISEVSLHVSKPNIPPMSLL